LDTCVLVQSKNLSGVQEAQQQRDFLKQRTALHVQLALSVQHQRIQQAAVLQGSIPLVQRHHAVIALLVINAQQTKQAQFHAIQENIQVAIQQLA